jgi:hypothetical protein
MHLQSFIRLSFRYTRLKTHLPVRLGMARKMVDRQGSTLARRGMQQHSFCFWFSRAFHHLSQTRWAAVRAMCGSKPAKRAEAHVPTIRQVVAPAQGTLAG